MISTVDAQSFLLLFKGKVNSYVKNELPKENVENGVKIKTKITNNEGKVDTELILRHLSGDFGVGICPVTSEGKCYFAVIDIDYYEPKIQRVLDLISEYQLPLLPFRSKSGGLHLYIFLSKAVSAKKIREVLSKLIIMFSLEELYGKGKVELFPKQDTVKENGFGSAITLPYFNAENPYTYLMTVDRQKVDFQDALTIIKRNFTTLETLEKLLEDLPYKDAPFCIQRVLLSGLVGAEDTGRNNFLFSYAVYAKKKYGAEFVSYVQKINDNFENPLDETIVDSICNSVSTNEYMYKCKDIPCNSFCNKVICKHREYGLGRDKGHFTNVDFSGNLYRYNAEEPYYVWQLRLVGQEEWKEVVFKNEGDILEQFNFAKLCVRYLNHAPMRVSQNDWYDILNTILPKVINIEVKAEVDTSSKALLRNEFITYLSNKQAKRDSPYQIRAGLAYYEKKDNEGKYYFLHSGFIDYLNNRKFRFEVSLLGENLREFGAIPDTFVYYNANGEQRTCPCWSKVEDDDIKDAYYNNIEVYEGDRASQGILPIGYASNKEEVEVTEDVPYTKEDLDNAQNLF